MRGREGRVREGRILVSTWEGRRNEGAIHEGRQSGRRYHRRQTVTLDPGYARGAAGGDSGGDRDRRASCIDRSRMHTASTPSSSRDPGVRRGEEGVRSTRGAGCTRRQSMGKPKGGHCRALTFSSDSMLCVDVSVCSVLAVWSDPFTSRVARV